MYWETIDSTIQPDPLLIQLSILFKIFWKDLAGSSLWFITVFVVELKETGENSVSVPLYFLTRFWQQSDF